MASQQVGTRTLSGRNFDELFEASDQTIENACEHADPMVLRGLLFQLTGDPEVADTQVKTVLSRALEVAAPENDEVVLLLRRKAVEFLKGLRDAGTKEMSIGPEGRLPTSLRLTAGEQIPDDAVGLWLEELALDPDARSLKWRQPPPDCLDNFSVIVIGAGMGGLNAALQLKRAGIPFTVIEKNPGVGGTWYENRYPGCRLDTPSRAYSHTVGVDFPYTHAFSLWSDNKKYTDWFTDNFGLEEDIVFNTEVTSLTWDDSSSMWTVAVNGPGGKRSMRANGVVTAVGFLNRPNVPEIPGQTEFAGASCHTARWPESADLKGKRVAVVGTGCTGYQLIPELALEVEELVVFQRTPQWIFDVQGYLSPLPQEVTWLERNFPYYTNFVRFRELHFFEASPKLTTIDPSFSDPHARSEINKKPGICA